MKSIKIEIPEGFEVDGFDKEKGLVTFKKVSAPLIDRVNTFELVCQEMGEDPKDFEVTETRPRKRALQIMDRILLIMECFQQGVEMDVYNTKQNKYWGWFDVSKGKSGFRFDGSCYTDTGTLSVLGSLLTLQDEKTNIYVHTTFASEFQAFIELTFKKVN